MTELRELAASAPVAELIEALLSRSGYLEALEAERTIEAQGRIENLEQLVEVGREFDALAAGAGTGDGEGEGALEEFLQQIALVADADQRSDDEGLVTLMTLHNAKGLEYPTVFIAGCEDGVFPHSRAIEEGGLEEERRLFYVGVTRAMRSLYLTYARRRALFGAQSYGLRSRFLDEIPAELLHRPGRAAAARGLLSGGSRSLHGSVSAGRGPNGGHPRWDAGEGGSGAGEGPRFRLGEDIVHEAFGDGVVTGVEPGGVIVVRFAGDGSERKLMADYAPLSRR